MPSSACRRYHPHLHSFPTRRSSDLGLTVALVITDLEMPRADGRAVLTAGLRHRVPVVILTGHSSVEIAVQLMRQGAANFLTKPFTPRSEEHTSELQSLTNLVCRLLLAAATTHIYTLSLHDALPISG